MLRCKPIDRIRTRSAQRGLSLLEMLIAMTLLGLFIGGVYGTVIVGLRTVHAADEREGVRQQLTNALDRLTREARMIRVVDNATATRFQFDADFDGNGGSTGDELNINYERQNGDLVRTRVGTSVTLVSNATSVTFDYTDLNGSDMTPPITGPSLDDIRVVEVTVTATNDTETISTSTSAYLTNM